ncbi:MAG: Zn-ribbon domain-containing OB-fold protein [Salinarimonadaceae bacterium]|nr:MAG: Zn-ribbon domain-containing OB-fold protein [Salinarimonadaceae bacterium]
MLAKPAPVANADTEIFWKGCDRGVFLYQRCRDCGRSQFYPGIVCRGCHGSGLVWEESAGRGTIYSFTVVHRATPAFRSDAPYALALVDMDEGFRIMANVINCSPESVKIGQHVQIVFEDRGSDSHKIPQVTPRE